MPKAVISVDLERNTAVIPGDGNTPVTFTHTFDLGKFVDRVLDAFIREMPGILPAEHSAALPEPEE